MTGTELHTKIGKLLQMERVRQQIELSDLATTLKITEANLQAVEDGDATRLPSELYFKLFAKSYAEELGIDYEATVEAIQLDIDDAPIDDLSSHDKADDAGPQSSTAEDRDRTSTSTSTDNKNGHQLKKLAYLLGAVIVVFIIVVVVNQLLFQDPESEPGPDSQSGATVEPEPAATSDRDDTAGYDWNVPDYSTPEPLTLILIARTESWASVLADGDTAIYRTLTPGRRYEVTAQYRLRVSVGVPSALTIELNGQPVNLRNPESGRIAGVEIDQVNLQKFLKRPLTQTRTSAAPPRGAPTLANPEASTSGAADSNSAGPQAVEPSQADNGTPEDTSEGR